MHTNISKAARRQTFVTLFMALALIVTCTGGLWAYTVSADAETGVQETEEANIPKESAVSITLEKYDNYPSTVSEEDLETWYQGFGLTKEEKERLTVLKTAYAAGTRPADKAPSMPAETGFAIMPLSPTDYDGITEFYFLPGQKLTDEQLLQLIDYGEKTGKPFTAETLSVKNCMRGGAIETNRFRSAGEDARRDILYRRITEEGLRPQSQNKTEITLPIASVADIPVNPDLNSGLDVFHFNPVREMTDEEIITELLLNRNPDFYLNPITDAGLDPVVDTAKARSILENVLNMPLSAANDVFSYYKDDNSGAKLLQINFKTPKINGAESNFYLVMEVESGQCHTMFSSVMDDNLYYVDENGDLMYGPKPGGITTPKVNLEDQRCAQSAKDAVEKLTDVNVLKVEPMTAVSIGNTNDAGIYLAVQMADGTAYQLAVRYDDAVVTGIDYRPDGLDVARWLKNQY
jgi:hypothetical protein